MIPNILHFIYLKNPKSIGNKNFGLTHFLSIKSAIEINKPEKAFLHYNEEQPGEFWKMAKLLCQTKIVKLPSQIFGVPISHIAHSADILKYQILLETGGIYLDTDIIHKKPMTELLSHKFVLGRQGFPGFEGVNGFCNAVILSKPNSEFLQKWLEGYDPKNSIAPFVGFRSTGYDDFYSEMSSEYPHFLAEIMLRENPGIIHIEPNSSFFYPMYNNSGLKMLFEENHDFPAAFCHHFWESAAKDYLEKLTIDQIRTVDTTYNSLARNFLGNL
jgi:hypothetical protein